MDMKFRWFRSFRWFRFGRFGGSARFGAFILLFWVLDVPWNTPMLQVIMMYCIYLNYFQVFKKNVTLVTMFRESKYLSFKSHFTVFLITIFVITKRQP